MCGTQHEAQKYYIEFFYILTICFLFICSLFVIAMIEFDYHEGINCFHFLTLARHNTALNSAAKDTMPELRSKSEKRVPWSPRREGDGDVCKKIKAKKGNKFYLSVVKYYIYINLRPTPWPLCKIINELVQYTLWYTYIQYEY